MGLTSRANANDRTIVKTLMKKTKNKHDIADFSSTLHWLAFCYVAGELSVEQTTQFEQRLAEDLDAQVAVADAVCWSEAAYVSLEAFQNDQVSLSRNRAAKTERSSAWRWMAIAATGLIAIVALWQGLPGSLPSGDLTEVARGDGRAAISTIALSESELWERTVELYQSDDADGDEFEIWGQNSDDGLLAEHYGQEYVNGDDDSEEIADALLVDSDLTSIFASALRSSLDPSKGDM